MQRTLVLAGLLVQGLLLFPLLTVPTYRNGPIVLLLVIPAAQLAAAAGFFLGKAWGSGLAILVSGLLLVLCIPVIFLTYLSIASSLEARNWLPLLGVALYMGIQAFMIFAARAANPGAKLA